MNRLSFVLLAVLASAPFALAHEGVKNPAVKARMDSMSQIADQTKVLGEMAKGARDFDAAAARAAAAELARHAAQTATLFAAPEDDPMSEALPVIWDQFADFSAKADAMETAALGAASSITDPASLQAALGDIGSTCRACHGSYRKK